MNVNCYSEILLTTLFQSPFTTRMEIRRTYSHLEPRVPIGDHTFPDVKHCVYLLFLQISTVLVEDYRVLSKAYVYWDNMVKDETEYEEGRFKMEMTAGLNKIRDVLCTLCSALQDTIECVVERSAMPDDVRNVSSRTLRFERDYDVARNTTEILKLMSRRYDSISSH